MDPASTDPLIEILNLSPTARSAAYLLKAFYPAVIFTSGHRTLASQASAMASNVLLNRQWIIDTYKVSTACLHCQVWINANPAARTQAAISHGLLDVLKSLGPAAGAISKHLTGDAFDVLPQVDARGKPTAEGRLILAAIRKLPSLTLFLDREAGLCRWHAQF